MGFGTGFMALTFWIIGRKVCELGHQHGLITPPELIRKIYHSPGLSVLFSVVMIVFTIPYLALQPMAAGYALEELIGLPYVYGCILVTGIILLYTLRGGLRAVAWTDLFQGLLMFVLLGVALIMVICHHGGLIAANQKVLSAYPELFSRPGGLGKYSVGIWFSFMVLWFFCDPMFPQLFQRFFSAKNERTIARTMLLYPLVCTVVFFMPITVGVLGRLSFPGLVGKEADRILPMVLTAISGDFMAALVLAAGLAALMSTMDSQLLTLSSIFSRDIAPLIKKNRKENSMTGRIFLICLGLAGLALAYKPPATILQIATQTFTGLAVLFPTVIFGLYLKRVFPVCAIASILAGEAALVLFYFKLIPHGRFLAVIWVMLITFGVYLGLHLLMLWREKAISIRMPRWLLNGYFYFFSAIFILAMDFWAWGKVQPLVLGIPLWIFYFVALSAIQSIGMVYLIRKDHHPKI
jgi:SSS family solute:Na+ symporter